MIKLNVDAMGSDQGPACITQACTEAIMDYPQLDLTLFGDEALLTRSLEGVLYDTSRMRIVHAPDIIENEEAPVTAIRRKKQASVVMAMTSLANDEADGFVGAGSTGAVLAGATLLVKRISGIMRPALMPLLPTVKGGQAALIDCGANVDCKAEWLAQFALMGSVYMQRVLNIKQPHVALLNNGVEAHKGNALAKAAYALIQDMPVHFIGNMEAREILSGDADVIVCDGFVGNVALKAIEGTARAMTGMLKDAVLTNGRSKMGGVLLKPALADFKKKMDYTEHGGAPLLGVQKSVIKAHGASTSRSFYLALRQCQEMVKNQVPAIIEADLGCGTPPADMQ